MVHKLAANNYFPPFPFHVFIQHCLEMWPLVTSEDISHSWLQTVWTFHVSISWAFDQIFLFKSALFVMFFFLIFERKLQRMTTVILLMIIDNTFPLIWNWILCTEYFPKLLNYLPYHRLNGIFTLWSVRKRMCRPPRARYCKYVERARAGWHNTHTYVTERAQNYRTAISLSPFIHRNRDNGQDNLLVTKNRLDTKKHACTILKILN